MTQTKSDTRWSSGTALPDVLTIGDPRLRKIAEEHSNIQNLKPLCDKLVQALRDFNGAGLAASQLGYSEPVVVVEVRNTDLFPDRPKSPLYIMINPKVTSYSDAKSTDWEGCFSVPGMVAKVERPSDVNVSYSEPSGKQVEEQFTGYLSRVVQHEIDHLNGILFTDIMQPKTLMTVDNWKKYELKLS